jgi:translation initiation factor IF-3
MTLYNPGKIVYDFFWLCISNKRTSTAHMKSPQNQSPSAGAAKGPQLLTDKIKAQEVRLLGEDETFGVISRAEAEQIAADRGLDLIIMSLDSSPPVVKLMDFGKFKFEKEKKAREAKKKQHTVDVKEIKMGVRIDTHDYDVKTKRAEDFLRHGHKVKLTIRLRGREVQHSNLAFDLAKRFVVDLENFGTPDASARMEGRQIGLMFSPGKKKSGHSEPTGVQPVHAEKQNENP